MNVVITGITSGLGEALVSQFKKDINLKIIGIYKDKKKIEVFFIKKSSFN